MRKIEMLLLEREDLIESLTDVDFIMIHLVVILKNK
jgi:hypothetical protein